MGWDPFMAFASAADAVLGPPDHTITLTSEQYGQAISDYLEKHKLIPPGRYHQSAAAVQEAPGKASLVVHCWRSDDPIETTAAPVEPPALSSGMKPRPMLCASCLELLRVGEIRTMGSGGPCWACRERKPCAGPLTFDQLKGLGSVHVVTGGNRGQPRLGHRWDRIIVTVKLPDDELDILRTRLAPGGKLELADGVGQ